ncbi:unnamed protein product [Nezara viridula]|uniref:Chitin-binding type-2 domain-containing protein n=1 Tax=Nezara viridula TaxID=85310 RepID=A0A9P0ML10_NEZVI|nr:unnamed protein product [Nezara viridula]
MPITSFSCRDKIIGGYYADPETDCQMFHVCVKVPGLGVQDYKFLCPNETSFDQENQICDDWYNIDCEASTLYYSDNFDLYRIGGDIPRTNLEPRLPSNNINNAVSEVDDDLYLQKSDRGESVGSDLLRGSHSSNFFSNKNRGREDDDYSKTEYKKSRTNVKKLLTGKRPLPSTQAPLEENKQSSQPQYRPKNNNFAGRISHFQRNQQQSTEAPARITETYNHPQSYTQRNFYSPTTPKIETSPATQRTEFFRNYNPTTKRSYYENTQNYNTQTTPFPQTTKNYQIFRTTTQAPTTVNYYETTVNYEKNNNYETQKLYKLNTGAVNQYDDSKDEFLKTAPSLNLGASVFNSLQNNYKSFNTSVSTGYNFNQVTKSTTENYQSQTYFNPTTQTQNYYNPSTSKPYQHEYYTTIKPQPTDVNNQNFYSTQPQQSTPAKINYQYTQTTQKPYQQQYTYSTESTYSQYNPTTVNAFQNQYNQQPQTTKKPVQQYNSQPIQPTYQTQNPQPTFPPQRNVPAQQSYQQPQTVQNVQQQFQPQRNPSHQPISNNYYNPTTLRPVSTAKTTPQSRGTRPTTLDATEKPRAFTHQTVTPNKDQKKEKEQYDYAYYDDGTQSEYDGLEPVEDFSRTKSKN